MPRRIDNCYKYVEVVCQWCGKTHRVTEARQKAGQGKYCSPACAKASNAHRAKLRARNAPPKPPRRCVICYREFIPKHSATTCSKECHAELMRRRTTGREVKEANLPEPMRVPMSTVFEGYEEYGKLWNGRGLDAQFTPVM